MMLGLCPMRATHVRLRTLSAGYVELPIWSCWSPMVCPTSCATTNWRSLPISESGIGRVRARGSIAAAWVKYQARWRFRMLWNMRTEPLRISPVRGSCTCGPTAFSIVDGSQRTTVWRTSSGDQSGSLAGTSRATIPSLKPAASKADCHSSMPARTYGFHLSGVAGST